MKAKLFPTIDANISQGTETIWYCAVWFRDITHQYLKKVVGSAKANESFYW